MMVTFVSQCEKKALIKSRRVLDAFANRIGSRTWQTVITNEGLDAVKRMLRKTASKHTAVSCHWIRSRSRSELHWIVGNQDKFNSHGYAPVNFTNAFDLKIDEIQVMTDKILANTQQQPLDQHLFAVGYLASRLSQNFINDEDIKDKQSKAVFVAGCLHDLGKIDPCFQSWVTGQTKKKTPVDVSDEGQHIERGKFSFEAHPRHNEISLLLYYLLDDLDFRGINTPNKALIRHTLYWHHAKPIRKKDFKTLDVVYQKLKKNVGDGVFTELLHTVRQLVVSINKLSMDYFEEDAFEIKGLLEKPDSDRLYEMNDTPLPVYKRYNEGNEEVDEYKNNIQENARNNLARSSVVTADRLISALSKEELAKHIEEKSLESLLEKALIKNSDFSAQIEQCLEGFQRAYPNSNRNTQQQLAASRLHDLDGIAVLNGPAGCGKTKIALEWASLSHAKQIIWICPRVQVCQGLLNDLSHPDYLPSASIEICTGEFKSIHRYGESPMETPAGEEFSGDIVLTTIDQVINAISTHQKITALEQYMNAHVVFDEYHEYINMPAFNLLFAELLECKKLQGSEGRALLVSATPNYYFLEEFLGLERDDVVGIQSFNESQYQISFEAFDEGKHDDSNPLYSGQPDNTFVISNTAITAQSSFIRNQQSENGLLLHSKFTRADKQSLFVKVVESFSKEGSHRYAVLRSGPVVQASLNISCDRMVTEFTHAENWLQRLGRLDRFGRNEEDNQYITAIPDTLVGGKQNGKCARFLNSLFALQSAKAWHRFLQERLDPDGITITRLYQLYEQFYDDQASREAVSEDLKRALKRSTDIINRKLMDPVSIPRKKVTAGSKVKIKKHSLRGDNRFVQMAVCLISPSGAISFPDQYAYEASDFDANLTSPVELICGYGDSAQNLLSFMAKKHHNIKKTSKSYNDNILLNEARNPETPIYLSYTPQDLEPVGGISIAHPNAIYYAVGTHQTIGALSISKLLKETV